MSSDLTARAIRGMSFINNISVTIYAIIYQLK